MALYLSLLFLHLVGLALGIGTGFAALTLGSAARDLPADERTKFLLRAGALRKNASYGLLLLILSGLAMFIVRGPSEVMAWGGPAFHLKLTLVVIQVGFFGYTQVVYKKVRLAGGGPLMSKLPTLGLITLGLSLATALSAVIAFK
jgi:predicted transporter